MRRGVVPHLAVRRRPPRPPLVEEDDAIALRVKKTPLLWRAARARAAMQEHHRYAGGIPAFFPIQGVNFVDDEAAAAIRLDRRVEFGGATFAVRRAHRVANYHHPRSPMGKDAR